MTPDASTLRAGRGLPGARRMRPLLTVLVSHPIQYYAPLYREIASRGNMDLHVVYLSDAGAVAYQDPDFDRTVSWDIPLLDGYPFTVLRAGLSLDTLGVWARHSDRLTETLATLKPDALLLHGYASRMNWVAQHWARRNGCRVLYTSDSNVSTSRRSWKSRIKHAVVSRFFRDVDVFLSTSEANEGYLRQFGVGAGRTVRTPFAIDVARFSKGAPAPGEARAVQFVWAGKLTPRKRPQDFIRALEIAARKAGTQIRASLIGDGPLRDDVREQVDALPPLCRVEVRGFVNQASMPAALQAGDVFVFTSENEPYGLIATEAAAAGLALIVAERIGCVGDTVLARPGVNALTYPPGDVEALAEAMVRLLTDADTLHRMQRASRSIAADHDIPVGAAAVEQAVRHALR